MQDRPAAQTSSDPNSTLAPSAAGSTLRISGRAGSCAVHGARMPNVLSSTQRATEFSPLPVIGGNAKPNTDRAFTQHALPLPASPQASHGEHAICVTELDEKAIHATVEAILREQRGIGFTAPGEQAGEDKGMIEQREANEGKKKAEQQTALAIPCEEGKRKAKVKQVSKHPRPAQARTVARVPTNRQAHVSAGLVATDAFKSVAQGNQNAHLMKANYHMAKHHTERAFQQQEYMFLSIPVPPLRVDSTDAIMMQPAGATGEAALVVQPQTGQARGGFEEHTDVDARRSMVLMENMTLERGARDIIFSPSRQPDLTFLGYFESIDAGALLRDFPMDGDMAGIDFLGGGITPRDLNDTGSPLGDGLSIGGDLLVASDQRTVHLQPNSNVPIEAHPNIGLPNKAAELNKDLLLSKQDQDTSPSTTSVKPLDPAKTHSKDSPPCPPAIQNSSLGQQHRCPHLVPLVHPSPGKSASCQLPITFQPLLAPVVAIPYSCSPHVTRVSWAANAHSNSPHMSRANVALNSPEAPLRVSIPADGALIARRRAAQMDKGLFARLSNSFTLPNSELQPVAGQHLLNSMSPLGHPQSPTQHFNQARASQAIPEPQQKVQQQYRQYQLHLTQEADALAPEPNIQDGAGDCPSHVPLSLAHIPERDLTQMDALWGPMHVAATQGNKHMTDKQPGPTQIEQTSAQAATSLGVMQMPDTTQFLGTAKRDRGASITNYDVDRKAREGSQPASAAQATLDAYVVLPGVMSIQPESPAWLMGCGLPTALTKACEAEKSTPTGPDLMMAEACLQDLLNDLVPVYEVGLDKPLNNESTELQRPAMLASEHMITDTSLPGAQPVTVPGILRGIPGKACSLGNISCSLHGNKGSGCGSLPTNLDALSSFDFLPRDMSSILGGLGSLSGGLSKLPSGLNSTPGELGRMLGDLGRIPGGLGLMLDGLGGPHGLLGSRGSLPPSSEDGLGSMFNNHSGLLGSLDSIPSGFSSVPRGSLNPNPRIFNTSSLGLTFSSPALQHNLPSGLPPTLICPQYSPPCLSGPHLDGLAGTWPGLSAWAGVPEMLKPPRLSQVPGSLMLAEPGGLANATASSTPGTMMTSSSRRRVTFLRSDSAGATPGYRHEALQSPVVGSAMDSDADLCGGHINTHSEEGLTEAAMTLRPHNSHGGKERTLSKIMMQEVYHLPINEAAAHLGVGVTVLKKFCRSFKVERWPYRKLKSIDKLMNSVEEQRAGSPVDTTYVLEQLQATKTLVYDDPEHALDERILKLRQANFKLEYKKRQTSSTPVPEAYGLGNTTSLHAEHAIPALAIMLDADAVAVISRAEAAI